MAVEQASRLFASGGAQKKQAGRLFNYSTLHPLQGID
jgi:hypothetical protein